MGWARRSKASAWRSFCRVGRDPAGAGRMPGVTEKPMAQRNRTIQRSQRSARDGYGPGTCEQYEAKNFSPFATTNKYSAICSDRAVALGPDHLGRGPADQELGVQDQQHHHERSTRLSPWFSPAHRWRTAWTSYIPSSVHRRTSPRVRPIRFFTGTALSMTGQDDRLPEPRELRKTLRPILLRRTRGEVMQGIARADDEIVRSPTEEQLEIHDGHMHDRRPDRPQEVLHRDGSAAFAEVPADGPDGGRQHLSGRQQEPEFSSKLERLASCWKLSRNRTERSCCSPNGRRCSI